MLKPTFHIISLIVLGLSLSNSAFADWIVLEDLPTSDQTVLRSIGLVSLPSALEGSHSHGQIGGTIGLGIRRPAENLGTPPSDASQSESSQDAVQIHVVKGLNAPIDLGFTFSNTQESPGSAMSAYLQWTIFEDFKLPSIAARIGGSQTFGYDFVEITGMSAQLVAGYDFFEFIGLHAGIGGSWHYSTIDLSEDDETFSLARSTDPVISTSTAATQWSDRHYLIGLAVKPWPPFLSIGAELVRTNAGVESGSFKIAIGM